MKYAIYDKAADGYLTKMEFEVGYTEHTQFECGYNEYITEAQLLDTPKEAADAIVRTESCKFMENGRFVVHSFDDTLKDQYIISEAGEPTKVVDNITVDLDGNINVKYGTMASHWSASSLEYAINRLNRLQEAINPIKYAAWCNTFDIYKVITVIDERSCIHYQFIKVTEKGLDFAKEEENPLNKRIEELERVNRILDDNVNYHNECRIVLSEMIRAIKLALYTKNSDKEERDKALERAEFYKRQANSVYGMTIPGRCCGKQMTADIITGKKILVDKKKYDDLVECVNTINTTYDILKCADFTMNKPVWFEGIIHRIENLTK